MAERALLFGVDCVFLKSLDRFLLVKLIGLSNILLPY